MSAVPSRSPDWLTAAPIAHRGLHDRAAGVIENSRAAAQAAIAGGYAIECDVQMSRDGEAFVFHDFDLERLTDGRGPVNALGAAELSRIELRGAARPETIPTLVDLIATIGGRTPLIVEIKSAFDGDLRLAERVARIVSEAGAPIAIKSFDPALIAHLRAHAPRLGAPLGVVAEAAYDDDEWASLSPDRRRALAAFLHWEATRPDFLSWRVDDLPHATPHLLRAALGCPVMAWTVRRPAQWVLARRWADQPIFEGRPA